MNLFITVMCLAASVGLAGCAKLSHLQELLTMKALSDNQALQEKYVKEHDKKFRDLLAAVQSGDIKNYPDKKIFIRKFGNPIYTKTIDKKESTLTQLTYRYPAKLSGSEKVYVYFDGQNRLVDYRHVLPQAPQPKNVGQ